METLSRCFFRSGKGRTNHDAISTTGNALADLTTSNYTAISNHRHIVVCFLVVVVTCISTVSNSGCLRYAHTQNTARGTSCARSRAYQNARCSSLHQVEGNFVSHAIPQNHRDRHLLAELSQIQG